MFLAYIGYQMMRVLFGMAINESRYDGLTYINHKRLYIQFPQFIYKLHEYNDS